MTAARAERPGLALSWAASEVDPGQVTYQLDGAEIGDGEEGFERVLQRVKAGGQRVVVQVSGDDTGGASLHSLLPFGSRLDELVDAAGGEDRVSYGPG